MEYTYDDSRLQKLFSELSEKRRRLALRGAFRRVATKVRRQAVKNMQSSGLGNSKAVGKSIRTIVFKARLGFKVTVAPSKKGNKGMYRNRRGLLKPVAFWAEGGTAQRSTGRSLRQRLRGGGRKNRGKMPAFGFMSKTKNEVQSPITNMIKTEIVQNIERIAKKYGAS